MRPRATEALEGEVAWMQVTGVGDASPFDEERELMREGEVESRADPSRPTQLPLSGHRQIARWQRRQIALEPVGREERGSRRPEASARPAWAVFSDGQARLAAGEAPLAAGEAMLEVECLQAVAPMFRLTYARS